MCNSVATMYIDTSKTKRGNKTYTRNLLRTSYREDGKVKHKTVLNLSICSQEEIDAIKLALKHKGNLKKLFSIEDVKTVLGKSIGAVWAMKFLAERTHVSKSLGNTAQAKLALLQVITRVIDQGSRLSAVRFAKRHAICEILGIKKLDEDDLYENLAWLAYKQEEIEKKLFVNRFPGKKPTLFLYDVTSSYLEGNENEFADWGYNRDKKKGKKQIVVGLLTGPDGLPVAVRVFAGNTVDTKTVAEQVRILAKNFGVKDVTLVGDRGMLKGPQVAELPDDFRYVTAISKPQIRKKLNDKIFQYELFTKKVSEIMANKVVKLSGILCLSRTSVDCLAPAREVTIFRSALIFYNLPCAGKLRTAVLYQGINIINTTRTACTCRFIHKDASSELRKKAPRRP